MVFGLLFDELRNEERRAKVKISSFLVNGNDDDEVEK